MKKLRFDRLCLMSGIEKSALRVSFDPRATVIIGENDTGKSSLIKSIYWTLGADAAAIHPSWKDADVTGMLDFAVDDIDYTIVRSRGRFGVFDSNGNLQKKTSKITKELAPYLADLFGFKLLLSSRDGEPQVPPPAFCFLPFYVDQDYGWQQPWQSFAGLQQFRDFKKDVISYHSGIRPNEYYELKTRANAQKLERGEQLTKRAVLESASEKLKSTAAVEALSFDEADYEEAIHRLIGELKSLREKRHRYSALLADAVAERAALDEQYKIARNALAEFDKDMRWLNEQPEEPIYCPVCGSPHENSIAHRFGIIEDREMCRSFMLQALDKMDGLKERIEKGRHAISSVDGEIENISVALNTKKGEIRLQDVLASEGKRQAINVFNDEIETLNEGISKCDADIAELELKLKELDDKKRRKKNRAILFGACTEKFTEA